MISITDQLERLTPAVGDGDKAAMVLCSAVDFMESWPWIVADRRSARNINLQDLPAPNGLSRTLLGRYEATRVSSDRPRQRWETNGRC
jgi:hypothetical protein